MTRETKIGLFVGMGVIILVGILISDHLSVAQRQQQPEFGRAFPEARDGLGGMVETINTSLPGGDRPVPSPGEAAPAPTRRGVDSPSRETGPDRIRQDVASASKTA